MTKLRYWRLCAVNGVSFGGLILNDEFWILNTRDFVTWIKVYFFLLKWIPKIYSTYLEHFILLRRITQHTRAGFIDVYFLFLILWTSRINSTFLKDMGALASWENYTLFLERSYINLIKSICEDNFPSVSTLKILI